MGAGNSLYGGKTVMAGTYMAEQMSPEQCTLLSATTGGPKKKVGGADDAKSKRRNQFMDIKDGAGCTMLPALMAIEPLLAKTEPDEKQAQARPRKGGPQQASAKKGPRQSQSQSQSQKRPPDASVEASRSRLYGQSNAAMGQFEEVLDKSNEELVAWLSRPKDGDPTRKSLYDVSTISHASKDSPRSNHSREGSPDQQRSRSKRHATYDELFTTALQGNGSAQASRMKTYMPGKAGKRLKPLVGQIQPIRILPENAVEALKETDRQAVRAMESIQAMHGAQKDRRVNSVVSRAFSKFKRGEKGENPPGETSQCAPEKPVVELGAARLSLVVETVGKDAIKDEVTKRMNADEDNIEVVSANSKMPQMRKEASEALRSFVFGAQSILPMRPAAEKVDESAPHKAVDEQKTIEKIKAIERERDKIFYQPLGTKREVIKLEGLWQKLDDDNSGRVNIQEFRAFAMKTGATIQKLSDKVMGPLLGKKSSFTIDDMMRIIWPCATLNDVKTMNKWIYEYHNYVKTAKTPAVIKHEELEALVHNFKFFDSDNSGQVTFAELTESGLLDKDMADRYMQEWDDDGSGELDQMEFCEMFCMAGYRVHPDARRATDNDGNRLIFEDGIGWHRKDEWEAFLKGAPLKNKEVLDLAL